MQLETKRQLGHIAAIIPALAIPFFTREQILPLIALGGFIGYYVLTKGFAKELFRKHEHKRAKQGTRTTLAFFYYPVGVFLSFLLYPTHIAVAAWCALAVGDAAATLAGRKGKLKLPWNTKK
ncbi:MAG: hypothetical protein GOV15_01170, partial [Candidatus Diapherotrites archaeon]|nr:hypothetical protein [Candidatus Diapherotrites archaeon]